MNHLLCDPQNTGTKLRKRTMYFRRRSPRALVTVLYACRAAVCTCRSVFSDKVSREASSLASSAASVSSIGKLSAHYVGIVTNARLVTARLARSRVFEHSQYVQQAGLLNNILHSYGIAGKKRPSVCRPARDTKEWTDRS